MASTQEVAVYWVSDMLENCIMFFRDISFFFFFPFPGMSDQCLKAVVRDLFPTEEKIQWHGILREAMLRKYI